MNGFAGSDLAGTIATWVAALVTIGVWSYLVGLRRPFVLLQYLLAGLATGYLALLAVSDVLIPRLITPLVTSPRDHLLLFVALALAALLVAASWLPRRVTSPATGILVAGIAAFAIGGAVVGTILPQVGSALPAARVGASDVPGVLLSLGITILVLIGFLHGAPRAALTASAASIGRWLLLGGIGAWLGFLVVSRLALLVDRIGFLLGDWLTVLR